MSQSGILDVEASNPQIPTSFVTDDGIAIPLINILKILGGTGITTTGLGNTVTINATGGGGTVTSVSGTAGRITSTGGTTPIIDIDPTYVGQNSINTLGTITTGTWHGTPIDLASFVSGNLAVSHLNSGTSASGTTFWRGDGTWATPSGTGIATISGDTGSTTSSTILFTSENSAGSSTSFNATSSTVTFNVSDVNSNTIIGNGAGNGSISGITNTGLGKANLSALTSGGANTALGYQALANVITGSTNIAIGEFAGSSFVGGESNNISIGVSGTLGESSVTRIGSLSQGACFVGGIAGVTVSNLNVVTINTSTGQLGSEANVSVPQGGTGVATLTGLALGSGTSAFTGVTYTTPTSWTPGISFGGATTGITYSSQTGTYIQIGHLVIANFSVTLSSKGSASGAAALTGLPVTSASNTGSMSTPINTANLNLSAGYSMVGVSSSASVTTAQLNQTGALSNSTALTDTNFANNTVISGMIIYFA